MDEQKGLYGWAVIVNSDLTEGRGFERIKHLCQTEATARRLSRGASVQGSDGTVRPVPLLRHDGKIYGPVYLEVPTRADDHEQERLDKHQVVAQKAKALGLSDDDLKVLRGRS